MIEFEYEIKNYIDVNKDYVNYLDLEFKNIIIYNGPEKINLKNIKNFDKLIEFENIYLNIKNNKIINIKTRNNNSQKINNNIDYIINLIKYKCKIFDFISSHIEFKDNLLKLFFDNILF